MFFLYYLLASYFRGTTQIFRWFHSACTDWLASLAFAEKGLSRNWDLFHISHIFASQSPPDKLTNQIANTPRKQPIKANSTGRGNPYSGIIYLRWTRTDRELHLKAQPWQRSHPRAAPSEHMGVWVAPAPLSRGSRAHLAASFNRGLSRVEHGTAWVCSHSSCIWALQALGEHEVWPQTSLCSPASPSSFTFPYPLEHKAIYIS